VEIRRYGSRALLVTPRDVAPFIDHPDVVEVVPGAETVLVVVADPMRLDSVRRSVEALEEKSVRTEGADRSDCDVVLDVAYDGDDLGGVADAAGLTVDEVVEIHSRAVYRCDFCGFAPGFAYLSGLDPRLRLPRRATPRTSVPAGSVAIAGPYTAAYPSASPGGWHLLGHTDATLWDLAADPPALITPGTTVRFRLVDRSGRQSLRIPQGMSPRTESGVLRVVNTGVATSVQDRGRPGYAYLGVPGSGAVDRAGAALVNRLVGNPPDAAVFETAGGLMLEAVAPVIVADAATGAVRALTAGETIAINPAPGELWAYLAVRGGFEVEQVLGSRSWDSLSKLGPTPPQRGETLTSGSDPGEPVATDQAPRHPPSEQTTVVRISVGPRADWFTDDALQQLTNADWTVASSSRVGARLSGPVLTRVRADELPSEGLVRGAIQVPPDGQPVVMLADHPTTGGYPVLAVIDEGDLARLAQRPPGTTVRFRAY
jgi:KipI family sensor histidine kinase inhibitor